MRIPTPHRISSSNVRHYCQVVLQQVQVDRSDEIIWSCLIPIFVLGKPRNAPNFCRIYELHIMYRSFEYIKAHEVLERDSYVALLAVEA